nr:toll/interleukin-1 receptor domain-containing protein [Candidatus Tectomicrobia bacterium]
MAHDVFISYSAKDKTTADGVCATLEANAVIEPDPSHASSTHPHAVQNRGYRRRHRLCCGAWGGVYS